MSCFSASISDYHQFQLYFIDQISALSTIHIPESTIDEWIPSTVPVIQNFESSVICYVLTLKWRHCNVINRAVRYPLNYDCHVL